MGTRGPVRMSNRYVHGCFSIRGNPGLGEVNFDATKWFEASPDDKIEALMQIGCAGDYEVDQVARYIARNGQDLELKQLYDQCTAKTTGISGKLEPLVTINRRDASSWVRKHRPELAAKLDKEGLLV